MAETLQQLDARIEKELAGLQTEKLRKFAIIYGSNTIPQTEAAIKAGYSARVAQKNATRSYKSTKHVIELIRHRSALEHGDSIAQHRLKLMNLYDLCSDPESETWEPRTAHAISRTLLEVDGILGKGGSQEKEITINIIDPVAAITKQNQELTRVIEHSP